jgi:hypothetical protein
MGEPWDANNYYLSQFIGVRQGNAIDANSCDYKGTSGSELNRIRDEAVAANDRYLALMKSLTEDQRRELRRFAEMHEKRLDAVHLSHDSRFFRLHSIDTYCEFLLNYGPSPDRPWEMRRAYYVGPRWVMYYDAYVAYRSFFFPPFFLQPGFVPIGA